MPNKEANEVHDHLRAAASDLERLQTLLADACETLLARFSDASERLRAVPLNPADTHWPPLNDALSQLGAAVTALQFQDMASQLIAHTHGRLTRCANYLIDAGSLEAPAPPPPSDAGSYRPNPVTQTGVSSGSIDLF